jgi:hypothetical protein
MNKIKLAAKKTKIIEIFYKKIGVKMKKTTDDVWEAIKLANQELFPNISRESKTISQRKAAMMLADYISRGTLINKSKEGYLKTNGTDFYEKEIQNVKALFEVANILIKQGVILPTKDVCGKDVYAIIPTSINLKGRGKPDQELVAMYHFLQSPIVEKFKKYFEEKIIKTGDGEFDYSCEII